MRKKLIMLASVLLVTNTMGMEVTNENELLIFTNGQYLKGKNKTVREVNFKNFNIENEEVEPPVDPEIPNPPVEPEIPDPPVEPEIPNPPVEPEIPDPPVEPEIPNPPVEPEIPDPPVEPVKIWEEGREIHSDNYFTTENLKSISGTPALKIEGGTATNKHTIIAGSGSQAIHVTGGTGINEGTIDVNMGSGILSEETGTAINKGIIDVNSTAGNGLISKGTGTIINDTTGVITLENGNSAMTIQGNGLGENKGKLIVNHTNAQAVSIHGGKFTNSGIIENNSGFLGQGIFATAGEVTNSGTINMNGNSGTGVFARDNAKFTNSGTINLNSTSNVGISILGNNAQGINTSTGVINLNGTNGTGVSVSEGAKFTNNGQIVIKVGTTGNREIVNNGGTILNKGLIKSNGTFEIDSNGVFEIGKGGVIEADKVMGDIKLNGDIAFNDYSNNLSEEILKTEEYQGAIISDSILYDSTTVKTENGYAVNLKRKEFTEILDNGLGNYLESNYTAGNKAKDKLYNELKISKDKNSLDKKVNNIFGNSILPNIKKQTLDLIRYTKDTLVKNVFNSKATKETRTIAGYDYKNHDVDSSSNLSGYEENINSIYLGMDRKVNDNVRAGAILTIGELQADYTMQNAKRDDSFLQANIFSQYNDDSLNYVFNAFIGGINGDLKRNIKLDTINSKLSTNLDSTYFGVSNIVNKRINYNNFILTPEFQVNATYLKLDGIKESGEFGITTGKEDVKSFEIGTGITVSKEFNFIKDSTITPRVGISYSYELGSPYKAFEGQILDISTDKFEISKNSIDRGRTELFLGVDVEKGNLKIYGDYKYNVEREENLATAGLIYKFN